jgi:hypothetical protein
MRWPAVFAGAGTGLHLRGYVDGRLVAAPAEASWTRGGLGKSHDWLRLAAEWLRIDSIRADRVEYGLPPHATIHQVQVSARLFY